MVGRPVGDRQEAEEAARRLMDMGCKKHVLITLGKNGAVLLSRNEQGTVEAPVMVESPQVHAVDTTVNS